MLEETILRAFEQLWDAKVAEIDAMRKKKNAKKGEKNVELPLIDFSQLNMLAIQILRIGKDKTNEEMSAIFENMLGKNRTIEDHKKYFQYAQSLARFIEQDTTTRIAEIVGNKTK